MTVRTAVVCDLGVGPSRGGRDRNEDTYLLCHEGRCHWKADGAEHVHEQLGEGLLAAVLDGMGGHADGHVASVTAARVLSKLYGAGAPPERPARVLRKYVLDAHQQLHRAAAEQGPVQMGTTLTAVWLVGGRAAWTQVGDSRLYLMRGEGLVRLTRDQTRNEFARRDGRQQTADGDRLTQNFIYGSRGLGNDLTLRIDQGVDTGAEELADGDRLLLCTDGLTSVLDDPTLLTILRAHPDADAAARALVAEALRRDSLDNITVVVIDIA